MLTIRYLHSRILAIFRYLSTRLAVNRGRILHEWLGRSMRDLRTLIKTRQARTHLTVSLNAKSLLTHRYLILLALLLAIVLSLPALWRGWGFEDDIYHRSILLSSTLSDSLKNLFVFLDPNTTRAQMEVGVLPWWTLETTKIAFFRPIAVLTLWLDYQLWPDSSMLMHAHNLVWYLAVCAGVAVLYRRLMGLNVASGLAILLFALNFPHVNAVYSIAARSQLIATFFGVTALWSHDKAVRDRWTPGLILGPAFLALSLFSAEAGVAIFGFIIAYAFFIDREPWGQRVTRLVPYLALLMGWRLVYRSLGYGAFGSGFYLDPLSEPLRFAFNVVRQVPILLIGQWVLPDPVIYAGFSTVGQVVYWFFAVAVLVVLVILLLPMFGKIRRARFWGLGMLLATIPICGVSLASGRHLLILSIGAIALMAQYIAGRLNKVDRLLFHERWKTFSLIVAVAFLSLHAFIYPVMASTIRWVADPIPAMMDLGPLPDIAGKNLIVVNSPSPGQSLYLLPLREVREQSNPDHLRILAPAHTQIEITRLDERTLKVKPESGYLIPTQIDLDNDLKPFPIAHIAYTYRYGDAFFRENGRQMPIDGSVDLPGLAVEVRSHTSDGRPWETHMTFDQALEHPSLYWLQWDWETNSYIPFAIPEEGESIVIEGPFEPSDLPFD